MLHAIRPQRRQSPPRGAWQPSLDLQTFNPDRFPFNSPTRDGEEEEEEKEQEEEEVTVVGGECFQSEVIPLAPHWPGRYSAYRVSLGWRI